MSDVGICEAGMKSVSFPPPRKLFVVTSWGKYEDFVTDVYIKCEITG